MLKEIQFNPFRILGAFSNSTMRDIVANEGKMKAFFKVGKSIDFPLDSIALIPSINRNEEIVTNAKSQIALPDDKVKHAQFWFIKSTSIDEIAFNHLFKGDFKGAIETFSKKKSASSLQNLMVCFLIQQDYKAAIQIARDLYKNYTDTFIKEVDQQASPNPHLLINHYIESLLSNDVDCSSLKDTIDDVEWITIINAKITQPIIEKLENALHTAQQSRKKGYNARLDAGKRLMIVVRTELKKLKGNINQLQFQVLSDKLANEILQSGIDYYNDSEDDDAAFKAMPLQKFASSIAVGSIAKDRCEENLKILQKIIDNLPPKEVKEEAKAIKNELEKFCKLSDKISHSVNLLNATKSHINAIRSKLGSTHAFYLKMSTQIVGNALHNVIEEVNTEMSSLNSPYGYVTDSERVLKIIRIKKALEEAWNTTTIMDDFDLEPEFKAHYNKNRSSLKSLCEKVGVSTSPFGKETPSSSPARMPASSYTAYSSNSSNNSNDANWGCIIIVIIFIIILIINLTSK